MTSSQAKNLALKSVRRRIGDAISLVWENIERVIRHVVYMRTEEVEKMIDMWLRDSGYSPYFCADCYIRGQGQMVIRLLYREAMRPNEKDHCGLTIGEITFGGMAYDGGLLL